MIYHVKDNDLNILLKGKLNSKISKKILSHIASCDVCSQRLAELTLQMATLTPPKGMYEEVLNASAKEKSRKKQKDETFTLYCVRVIAGICAAIVLTYSGFFKKLADIDLDMTKVNNASCSISERLYKNLNDFSDTLFNREEKA